MNNTNEKPYVVIDDWRIVQKTPTPYDAPELIRYQLYGKVYGHPDFEDGTYVYTSECIEPVDLEKGKTETKQTFYSLAMPNFAYVEWCVDSGNTKILDYVNRKRQK